ncbi:MAG: hypothetical protein R3F17_07740 [Planctomycetota bacterium]
MKTLRRIHQLAASGTRRSNGVREAAKEALPQVEAVDVLLAAPGAVAADLGCG